MALPSHPYSQRITKPNRRKWLSRKAKRICWRSDREGRGGGNVPTGAISDPPSLIPGVGQGFRRRNRLWRSTGFPGPAYFRARDPRTVYMASRLVEAARELAIGIVLYRKSTRLNPRH